MIIYMVTAPNMSNDNFDILGIIPGYDKEWITAAYNAIVEAEKLNAMFEFREKREILIRKADLSEILKRMGVDIPEKIR